MDDLFQQLHHLIGREGEDITWWQMSVRAVVIFGFGLALVRLAGKRLFGRWGAMDIILSVIIDSNLSRTLTGGAPFLQTLLATTLLVALHAILARAAVYVRPLGPLLKGHPAQLIEEGRLDRSAMARHGVGDNDLEQALRCSGLDDLSQVRAAWIERNGEISILKRP